MLKSERETIIRWDDEEKIVHLYTTIGSIVKKCRKDWTEVKSDGIGTWFTIPLSAFRFRKRKPRVMSELQKSNLRARMSLNNRTSKTKQD